jgi:hypothetical protein
MVIKFDPVPCVYVGTVGATIPVPLCAFRGGAGAIQKLALTVASTVAISATDYWTFSVELRGHRYATVEEGAGVLTSRVTALVAEVWTTITERVRMQKDSTVQIRITKTGSPADLSGLAFSWVREVE